MMVVAPNTKAWAKFIASLASNPAEAEEESSNLASLAGPHRLGRVSVVLQTVRVCCVKLILPVIRYPIDSICTGVSDENRGTYHVRTWKGSSPGGSKTR